MKKLSALAAVLLLASSVAGWAGTEMNSTARSSNDATCAPSRYVYYPPYAPYTSYAPAYYAPPPAPYYYGYGPGYGYYGGGYYGPGPGVAVYGPPLFFGFGFGHGRR